MTEPAKTARSISDGERQTFHHGDLPRALLGAAEQILRAEGLNSLTLRRIAATAGVSHAAPSNHFDGLAGLLSELAALGHRRSADAIRQAAREAPEGQRLKVAGKAYVAFATENPGLFALMNRRERLDPDNPALQEAWKDSRDVLDLLAGFGSRKPRSRMEALAIMTGSWALVHGYAELLLNDRLNPIIRGLPEGTSQDDLLDLMLDDQGPLWRQ